jgi:Flp pilus assembly protein TadG
MAPIRARNIGGGERGAALVELAVVMPLLLVVTAGIVDFGFALQRYEVIANGAREGARLASEPGYDAAAVQTRVRGYVQQGLNFDDPTLDAVMPAATSVIISNPTLTIPLAGGGSANLTSTRVDVFYHHQFMLMGPVFGLINAAWSQSITLQASSLMRTQVGGS